MAHLAAIVVFGLFLTMALGGYLTAKWFGMAIVVTGITVLVAGGRSAPVGRIRMLGRRLDLISGAIMALAGLFIVWYWGHRPGIGI